MRTVRFMLLVAFAVTFWSVAAHAWPRMPYKDAEVVARSELIVVAALKADSLVVVPHPHRANEGRSWETHATLLVHEVIKGESYTKELPIVIRYGLDVFIDDESGDRSSLERTTPLPAPQKTLTLVDTGSDLGSPPIIGNLHQDHVWFLRRGGERAQPDDKNFGIVDPEDVQPLGLRKYLESYLTADPEAGVRAALQRQPEIAARAVRYLEHREIARILKEKDAAVRVERLLPYYCSGGGWDNHFEARAGIVAAGEIAGPYLLTAYLKRSGEQQQQDVIRMWGEIRYKACVPILMEVLKQQERFWAEQELKPGWWNAEAESRLTQYRRDSYGLVYTCVYVLGQMGDPGAREVLELTRRRWAGIPTESRQILDACEQALRGLGPAQAATAK